MVEGILKNGFCYRIEDEALDDYEMFEKLCAIDRDSNNISLVTEIFTDLLGVEQYKALKEYMRSESGRISTTRMVEALHELLEADEEVKNS